MCYNEKKFLKINIISFIIVIMSIICINSVSAKSYEEAGINAFCESYRPYLNALAKIHPNWKFVAVNTNLNWNDVVAAESAANKSLIPISYSLDWKENDVQIENGWVNASDSAIAYALDPRNFLSEEKIFQFETTYNNSSIHTLDTVEKVLTGTPMVGTLASKYKNAGNWLDMSTTYSNIILNAGRNNNISPVHLSSRIRQENAGDIINNRCINGSYANYEGYYNFFNIAANNADGLSPLENALKRAKLCGWTNPTLAIEAAGLKIYSDYTKWGQNTVYFEKWDVNDVLGTCSLYWMQYMTNILAPSSESSRIFSAYSGTNKLNSAFEFHIPVYNNMPSEAAQVGSKPYWQEDNTKVYLDDTSDTGVSDTFYIRAEPDSNSAELAKIIETSEGQNNRTVMTRIGEGKNIQWDKVRLKNGVEGYVFNGYVKIYNYIKVTGLTLTTKNISLKSGQTYQLSSTILPTNAEFKEVRYKSSNEYAATVDKNGVVTARGIGQTTIYAISDDQLNVMDSCTITIDYTERKNVKVGESFELSGYGGASYFTNNNFVLSVDGTTGKVTARFLNDASVFIMDSSGRIKNMIHVHVDYTSTKNLKVGEVIDLSSISSNAKSYYSNNEGVMTVESNGKVTGRFLGEATLFILDANGNRVGLILIKVEYSSYKTMKVGETLDLSTTVIGSKKYYGNNDFVMTVGNDGKVTGRFLGAATVFVLDSTGKNIGLIHVTVEYSSYKTMKVGETLDLSTVVTGGKTYYGNNDYVMSVGNNGKIIGRFLGEASVFIFDVNGNRIGLIHVTVEYSSYKTIKVGETLNLSTVVTGGKTYYGNNKDVITVGNDGNVTGRFLGAASVFIFDANGNRIGLIHVTVEYSSYKTIKVGETLDLSTTFTGGKTYYGNNKDVITVGNDGKVTGRFLGAASVFIFDANGNRIGLIHVTVEYSSYKTIKVGETLDLSTTITGGKTYYGNNTFVMNVSSDGKVTGKYLGTASVFVQDASGNKIGLIHITVDYTSKETVKLGDVINVKALQPNAYSWYSNNAGILSVQTDKSIIAGNIGEASIFVGNASDNLIAIIYVKVE